MKSDYKIIELLDKIAAINFKIHSIKNGRKIDSPLSVAFIWSKTPEGYTYWAKINRKISEFRLSTDKSYVTVVEPVENFDDHDNVVSLSDFRSNNK